MTLSVAAAEALLAQHSPADEAWPRHCRQVAKVARHLAEALLKQGVMSPEEAQLLEVQSLLHDIGRSRTHGPLHGWSGYVMLRALGHAREARGCLSHWLKGRDLHEVQPSRLWTAEFATRAWSELHPPPWTLLDSALSVADSSVQHTTIVPLRQRHEDLYTRYGDSPWLRRAAELAELQAEQLSAALGCSLDAYLDPLFGDQLD